MFACVLLSYQCGICPIKCCDYDNDGLCWGCVCCKIEIDPCWGPRNIVKLICACIPCGCIAQETIFTICCCNPGKETEDPAERQKKIDAEVARQEAAKK